MSLHLLAQMIADNGHTVYVTSMHTAPTSAARSMASIDWSDYDPEKTVVVYPDVITGNPLNGKHVARWLITGSETRSPKSGVGARDRLYSSSLGGGAHDPSGPYEFLSVPSFNDKMFTDRKKERGGQCYLMSDTRTVTIPYHAADAMPLNADMDDSAFSEAFNRYQRFVCYDPDSIRIVQALLCGCIVVVAPLPGVSKADFFQSHPILANGIAYGHNDVPQAVAKRHVFLQQIRQYRDSCSQSVRNFIHRSVQQVHNDSNTEGVYHHVDVVITSNTTDQAMYRRVAQSLNSLLLSADQWTVLSIIVVERNPAVNYDRMATSAAPHTCRTIHPDGEYDEPAYQALGMAEGCSEYAAIVPSQCMHPYDWASDMISDLLSRSTPEPAFRIVRDDDYRENYPFDSNPFPRSAGSSTAYMMYRRHDIPKLEMQDSRADTIRSVTASVSGITKPNDFQPDHALHDLDRIRRQLTQSL